MRVLGLMGLFMMLVQVHRSSGAIIANELGSRGLAPSDIAFIVSALFLAAAVFQLPTGLLFDRYGARFTTAGLGLVAVAGIFLFAFSGSVLGLGSGRFLIGLGHGGVIAAIYLLALGWVPPHHVATATGATVAIAGGIGGLLATAPLVLALDRFGHAATFSAIGATTLAVTVAIGLLVRDAPAGRAVESSGRRESLAESVRGLWAVATERDLWPVYAMATCFSLPFATIGGLWSGPYLHDVHGLDKREASLAVLFMVAAFHLGNLVYGPVERLLGTRKWVIAGGVIVLISLLGVLTVAPGLGRNATIVVLVVFCLFTQFYPVLAAQCQGFVPLARAGRAIACVNLMGLATVFVVQMLTGWLVELTAGPDARPTLLGYRLVFLTVAAMLVLGLLGYLKVRDVPP